MRSREAAAFSLVEVVLALGVAAICLLGIFGLMPIGMQTHRNATSQTTAANIVAAVIADLRATPSTRTTSSQFNITFGTNPPPLYFDGAGQFSTSLGGASRYQLNLTWNASAPAGLSYADLKVTWPATATPTNASGAVELFVAFDRN
jgi:uncharacterized protein (TIGR02598 family)